MRSSYWKCKDCVMLVQSGRKNSCEATHFLDFLIIECTGYKKKTCRIVDAKCPTSITTRYFIQNRRCWKSKRARKFSVIIWHTQSSSALEREGAGLQKLQNWKWNFWTFPIRPISHNLSTHKKFADILGEQQLKLNSIVKLHCSTVHEKARIISNRTDQLFSSSIALFFRNRTVIGVAKICLLSLWNSNFCRRRWVTAWKMEFFFSGKSRRFSPIDFTHSAIVENFLIVVRLHCLFFFKEKLFSLPNEECVQWNVIKMLSTTSTHNELNF